MCLFLLACLRLRGSWRRKKRFVDGSDRVLVLGEIGLVCSPSLMLLVVVEVVRYWGSEVVGRVCVASGDLCCLLRMPRWLWMCFVRGDCGLRLHCAVSVGRGCVGVLRVRRRSRGSRLLSGLSRLSLLLRPRRSGRWGGDLKGRSRCLCRRCCCGVRGRGLLRGRRFRRARCGRCGLRSRSLGRGRRGRGGPV